MKFLAQVLLFLLLVPLQVLAAQSDFETAIAKIFAERPYELNLGLLQAPDPKPLKIGTFSPDQNTNSKGLQIISEGRVFPFRYEIISVENVPSADILETIVNAEKNDPEAILLEKLSNDVLGTYVHYFRRVSTNGKPRYISSNYIFLKGSNFFHLSAANYAPMVFKKNMEAWGEIEPDKLAEDAAQLLLKAFRAK